MTHVKHSQIFAIALPMILSNITAPLLGLVDTAVIGHLSHAYFLGGSTVGAMLITFVTWLCGFLRMSTTGLSAHAYGAQESQESYLILVRGLMIAFTIGLLIIVLQLPYINAGLWLAGGSEQVQFYAAQYAHIRVWGLPAALANIVIVGWLLGQHKAKMVMWLLIATNIINLSLDLLFVVVFDWQVQGVAAATLIAEISGLLIGLGMILHHLELSLSAMVEKAIGQFNAITEREPLMAYFHLNKNILIRTLCLELCFVFMTFQGARLGDDIIAANAILMNFLLLISFGLDGIANAAEVLVGKAKGQKNPDAIKQVVSLSLMWTAVFAVAYSLLFLIAEDWLISLISDIPNVIATAKIYYPWVILLPIIACWCFLFDGVYVGLMNARVMRNSMLISTFGCFFPVWALLSFMGNHGLWLAFTCFMLTRGMTLIWHYYGYQQHRHNTI
ncbi:MATE family efflux transporter [Thalassotalea atypica]|uniref:MATE family efflux transporter n=1 Tax=Thalassotalea atypica TaxID=2054316 RepID=UPI0025723F3E|nr:MATE family efflux transporter [Thalassotalea atypica]